MALDDEDRWRARSCARGAAEEVEVLHAAERRELRSDSLMAEEGEGRKEAGGYLYMSEGMNGD